MSTRFAFAGVPLALFLLLFALPNVQAADIALSSQCGLADAIIAANTDRAVSGCRAGRGADTITLHQDITLRTELPAITSDITIEGNGYTISGGNRYRIFYNDGGALTIHDLTMTKGRAEGKIIRNADGLIKTAEGSPVGGAILNLSGTVTISDSSFSGNSTEGGGAIANGEDGELSISDSTFSNNSAERTGGAIDNRGELDVTNSAFQNNLAEYGGVILNSGELSVTNGTFSDNSAELYGGAIYNAGELSISDSTFSDNSADRGGGAIFNGEDASIANSTFNGNSAGKSGGAIDNLGELSMTNSTFNGNSAEYGGAIVNWRDASIANSTFSGNSAKLLGGAILNGENGELSMTNSIIASRGADACYSEGRLKRNINNFIQDGTCSPAFSGDPKLGRLVVPEDGLPAYFPLLAGSRAIDAADDDYCPATDQIGTVRPQGKACDIGAVEYSGES